MSDQKTISGSCLCGEIAYEYTGTSKVFQYCHCSRCQKVSGTAHASNLILSPKQFKWTKGETNVGRYEHPEAKHFATSFCKTCGSSLPWLSQGKHAVVIPAGTLDQDPDEKPIHNVFMGNSAAWYVNPEEVLQYEALPTGGK